MGQLSKFFCVLMAMAVVFANTIGRDLHNTNFQRSVNIVSSFGGSIGGAAFSSFLPKKYDFNNAFIDTAGVAFDYYQISKKIDHDLLIATGLSFGTNYVIRKVAKQLNNNGISVENLAHTGDILPEGIVRSVVNGVVRSTVEIVSQPQVITAFIMAYIIKPLYCESD